MGLFDNIFTTKTEQKEKDPGREYLDAYIQFRTRPDYYQALASRQENKDNQHIQAWASKEKEEMNNYAQIKKRANRINSVESPYWYHLPEDGEEYGYFINVDGQCIPKAPKQTNRMYGGGKEIHEVLRFSYPYKKLCQSAENLGCIKENSSLTMQGEVTKYRTPDNVSFEIITSGGHYSDVSLYCDQKSNRILFDIFQEVCNNETVPVSAALFLDFDNPNDYKQFKYGLIETSGHMYQDEATGLYEYIDPEYNALINSPCVILISDASYADRIGYPKLMAPASVKYALMYDDADKNLAYGRNNDPHFYPDWKEREGLYEKAIERAMEEARQRTAAKTTASATTPKKDGFDWEEEAYRGWEELADEIARDSR